MSFANKIRTGRRGALVLTVLGALGVTVVLAGCGSSSSKSGTSSSKASHAAAVGQPPPESAANADAWPAHNHDLSNTRATTQTPTNSKTVSKLKVKWTFKFPYIGQFGAYTSNPIVLNGVVYIEDPDSNV
jgi:glucose dehydrogenase